MTEADWFDHTGPSPFPGFQTYSKSKVLAEKAAWEFHENLPEAEKFVLCVMNPGLILGGNLNTATF